MSLTIVVSEKNAPPYSGSQNAIYIKQQKKIFQAAGSAKTMDAPLEVKQPRLKESLVSSEGTEGLLIYQNTCSQKMAAADILLDPATSGISQ